MKAAAPLQHELPKTTVNTTASKTTLNPLQLKTDVKEVSLQMKQNPLGAMTYNQNPLQLKENKTGLTNALKANVEVLSGYSMDDVRIHYNSDKPRQLQALAYAQGTNIHIAPGQEKYLPHEAWHVVQQKQGRVQPTLLTKGMVAVNDNETLEKDADIMGEKALQLKANAPDVNATPSSSVHKAIASYKTVTQFGRGKVERKREKEKEKQIRKEQTLDPNNPNIRKGLDVNYTDLKLDVSEQTGGHARERHAAKDQAYLVGRNIPLSTTFDSEEDQNTALEQLLVSNSKAVASWIADPYSDNRLVIRGEVEGVNVTAVRKQRQIGVTSSGYEYQDPAIPRFAMESNITHAVAVLERYLLKANKGATPKAQWRVITIYPTQ